MYVYIYMDPELIKAPLLFFDLTPSGSILNRTLSLSRID